MIQMPAQVRIGAFAIACVICALIGAIAAGVVQDWRFTAQIATINEAHTAALKDISDAAQAATAQALAETKAANAANAALDAKYSKELKDAQTSNAQLRDDVDTGKRRLRLAATCPARSDTQSGQTSASVLADGAGPELTGAGRSAYFTLRERIATATSQINGLQAYVRDVCLQR